MKCASLRSVSAAVLLLFFACAHAASALTVSPVKIETAHEPGGTLVHEVELFNEESASKTLYSSFENFEARGESGAPYFTGAVSGLATWMTTEASVTLAPGERKVVPFTIRIPPDAEPGGHFAALFWGTAPPEAASGQVAIGGKVGVLILLSIAGDVVDRGAGILDFSLASGARFVSAPPVLFSYRFGNNGAERVKPEGSIIIENIFGRRITELAANPHGGNVLPGSIRRFEVLWGEEGTQTALSFWAAAKNEWRDFFFGPYTARLGLSHDAPESSAATLRFFVIPWHLLAVILGVVLILGVGGAALVRRYNRWILGRAGR